MSSSPTKIHTTASQVSGSAPLRRRRTKLTSEKKIANDEFMAAAIGDVRWLKQSLKSAGLGISYDKNGLAPIHLAAIHGQLDCLKTCIEKFKVNINLPSSTGWRAAHLCISNQTGKKSSQCLMYLLEHGADCSVANNDGITPVHQAASEGHEECLKLLLEANAKFDGKDCRGNTPLDLAKLWGHRKCARIIAAEIWHQDKEFTAKEILQLKKIKMQHVLKEFEEEEKAKAARQMYEDEIFKQWLMDKKASDSSRFDQQNRHTNRDSVYRANSRKLPTENKYHGSKTNTSMGIKTSLEDMMTTDKYKSESALIQLNRKTEDFHKPDKNVKPTNNPIRPLSHNSLWNKSTHVHPFSYMPNLEDYFPRDEYTMMPQVKGAPKYFDGKFFQPITPDKIDEDIRKKGSTAKLRKPKLSQDVINALLSNDTTVNDRGMVFKCKHIEDLQIKKRFDFDTKGYPEVPLHLTNDIHSSLVQNSLRIRPTKPQVSASKINPSSKEVVPKSAQHIAIDQANTEKICPDHS